MSCHFVYQKDGGAKFMRPIHNREEYLQLRDSERQRLVLQAVRKGSEEQKHQLVQFNYSCLPNDDGSLKGSKTASKSVGMDIDFKAPKDLSAQEQQAWLAKQMAGVPELVLSKRDELGLLMLERSATKGFHLVFRRHEDLSQEENLQWASELLGVAFDDKAKDITRVFFTTTADADELLFLDDELFDMTAANQTTPAPSLLILGQAKRQSRAKEGNSAEPNEQRKQYPTAYHGIPFEAIIHKYWEVNNKGFEPTEGDRDTLTFQLASDLRHICGKNFDWLDQVIPCYDGFPIEEKRQKIRNALASKYEGFPQRLRDTLNAFKEEEELDETTPDPSSSGGELNLKRLPQGIKDSIAAVGPALAMPIVTAICPCIGALATGVKLDVHGQMRGLNLIAYITGEFASGKGSIDPVIGAWMSEVQALDDMYIQQEDEFRRKKNAAKNQKNQPEEPKLPVRYITFNTTVANLAERLANVEGKHAFSFTPEADIVAQKWKSSMSDFSVMLRQSYDGSRYDREARSAEAVNVHIKHLLWNVTMCGTPDALYRVVTNYTDGFQSRIALAQTPDNTYTPLGDKPDILSSRQAERIQQIAHLLPLMTGEVVLPKLEARGREWLERIRLESMMNDDRVKARERFRTCVTTQRMVCCIMLCKVCEQLIQKHGLVGAETQLKQHPDLWRDMLLKVQTPAMLDIYDVIADSLLDNALYFFRERIENAFRSRNYIGGNERRRQGKNDSIYERLDFDFSLDMALQHSVSVNGAGVSRNQVHQMLKNWRKQGLITQTGPAQYRKLLGSVS
ncbi:DUF3987 domain-containing protein [Prevotella sp. P6B1]|uniref:DUF3987 domain-containing protein n=1 Tax=Prevotella sp. P6B1 TaxID=1410613 RepID=UPI00051AACAF|nr:DUF3987 domain-containing protein [Prevotella sp. P6B1]